jgi:hypothetical protein
VRKILILGLAAILTSCAMMRNHGTVALRFDGVYQSERVEDYWNYLHFYPDGTVITVSSTGQPEDLRTWFTKEHVGVSIGKVTRKGGRVSFSATSSDGSVDYDGRLVGDQVHLDSYSHINGHRSSDVFKFVRWKSEQGDPPNREKARDR